MNVLRPAGGYAELIADLYWIFFAVCAVAWTLVVVFLLVAIFRRRREPTTERRLGVAVGTSIAATVLALFTLLFFSTRTGAALARVTEPPAATIEITAQQWWWDVEYDHPIPSQRFSTANEIYVPVGQPVQLILDSRDVIHSFWVPNIHGKRDLIPGMKSTFIIRADREGTWEGQCAEFCGLQHAKMRLTFTALPQDEFAKWAEQQRRPAREPASEAEKRGQEVFMKASCPLCHTVSGTYAHGTTGPDLTHIASRRTIAAGTLPNTRGHLAGWIVDPQSTKAGTRMPPNQLPSDDLQFLLTYMESLR